MKDIKETENKDEVIDGAKKILSASEKFIVIGFEKEETIAAMHRVTEKEVAAAFMGIIEKCPEVLRFLIKMIIAEKMREAKESHDNNECGCNTEH